MELYNNMYQYLRQTKMQGYWEMKESGEVPLTEKMDLHASFAKAISSRGKSSDETAVQAKLGKIRAKLKAGARLTSAEKEFLKKHDPQLYMKVMALEQEQAAYEDRLKKCRTRDDAERIKTQKLAEMASNLSKEDAEYLMIRLNQMKEAEKKMASIVTRKPWQKDLDKKQLEARKKAKAKEDKEIRKRKAEKKRREEAARKKKMEEKMQQEAALKKEMTEELIEEKMLETEEQEERGMEMRQKEIIAAELMASEVMNEERIAKYMIAAGMMDNQATKIQMPNVLPDAEPVAAPLSLGSSRGFAAYKAAVDLPEFQEKETENKPYVRRA